MVALLLNVEDDNASSISANHRGGDAACAVWKALWKARERRNNQEAQEKGGTLPAFDGFCAADAVLYNDGTPTKWIFSDNVTGKLLRKAQRNVSVEAFRNGAPRSRLGEEVALIVRDDDVLPLSADPKKWGAISGKAVVCNVPGTRLKHAFPRDLLSPQSACGAEWPQAVRLVVQGVDLGALEIAASQGGAGWCCSFISERHRGGHGTRVRSLTSVWALDEKKATRVVDNGVPDAPAMTFERALEVEFLQPLHRGGSDAGSVLGDSSGRAHGAAIGPCPGGFCGLARIDETDGTDGAPASTERTVASSDAVRRRENPKERPARARPWTSGPTNS